MTQFQEHIDRMAEESEDYLPDRETGVECEYKNHRGDADAVVIIAVNNVCCEKEEYSEVRACWKCAIYGARDQWYCKCETEDSLLTSQFLRFVGEIQPKEREDANA